MIRVLLDWYPKGTVPVSFGFPKPNGVEASEASSRTESTLWKLGWFKAFNKVVRNSNDVCSLILIFLKLDKLAMFVMSSVTMCRGVSRKGVPNIFCAVEP